MHITALTLEVLAQCTDPKPSTDSPQNQGHRTTRYSVRTEQSRSGQSGEIKATFKSNDVVSLETTPSRKTLPMAVEG